MGDHAGIDGIHAITGDCDLCGDALDVATEQLNALTCTYTGCSGLVYHQDCLERYLKGIKLERCGG
jgi:hypothetical protein